MATLGEGNPLRTRPKRLVVYYSVLGLLRTLCVPCGLELGNLETHCGDKFK